MNYCIFFCKGEPKDILFTFVKPSYYNAAVNILLFNFAQLF